MRSLTGYSRVRLSKATQKSKHLSHVFESVLVFLIVADFSELTKKQTSEEEMMGQREDEEFQTIHHTDVDSFDISGLTSRL